MFVSINSSVAWLGINVSPFCANFSSLFQQETPTATVATLCNQSAKLSKLQNLEHLLTTHALTTVYLTQLPLFSSVTQDELPMPGSYDTLLAYASTT